MPELEGPDELLTLARASEISGIGIETLRTQRRRGRLQAKRLGHNWLTTRRWLHRYITQRGQGHHGGLRATIPPGYRTPDGEIPIAVQEV